MSSLNEFGVNRGVMALDNHICDSTPCFGFLHGSMPRNITPSDIDGIVEINGKFWVLEFKKTGKALPVGQLIMLKRLLRKGDVLSVIWHDGLTRENKITKIQYHFNGRVLDRLFTNYKSGQQSLVKFAKWWSE